MLKHPRRGDAKKTSPSRRIVALLEWSITVPAMSSFALDDDGEHLTVKTYERKLEGVSSRPF